MKLIPSLLAAAATLALAGAATAGTYTASPVLVDVEYTFTGVTVAANAATFADSFFFDLKAGDLDSSASFTVVAKKLASQSFNLKDIAASLFMVGNPTAITAALADGFANSFTGLAAGSYHLDVAGKVVGSKGGTYDLTLSPTVTAVPEPETYAMMLAGLGALGFLARRRNNSIDNA